jgi:acetoin utilization protein AcuB
VLHFLGHSFPTRRSSDLIRHLPVVEEGRVVGVVSNRDLGLAEALLLDESRDVAIADVMSADVYVVDPRANLGQVARSMAESKLGSAIVVERGNVVGIFTTVDALNALSQAVRGFSEE